MYNPFDEGDCLVMRKPHVEVRRVAANSGGPTRFHKQFLAATEADYRYWNTRENEFLIAFRQKRLDRVVQAATVAWNAAGSFDYIETIDAGPSIYDWLRVQPRLPDGRIVPHPFHIPAHFFRLLREAIAALAELHAAGFVHCDLREGNLCLPYRRSSTPGMIEPEWQRLRLIDFAFSLAPAMPLRQPLPIEPDPAFQSAAFAQALESDHRAQRPAQVQRLDGRIDLCALGLLADRLLDRHTVGWGSSSASRRASKQARQIVDELRAIDTRGPHPGPRLYTRLLATADKGLRTAGADTTFAIAEFHKRPLALQPGTVCSVRPTPVVPQSNSAALPTPLAPAKDAQPTPIAILAVDAQPTPLAPPPRPAAPIPIVTPVASRPGTSPRPALPQVVSKLPTLPPSPSPPPASPPRAAAAMAAPRTGIAGSWEKVKDTLVLEAIRRQAAKGNPDACYRMGLLYIRGYAVAQDFAAARQWLQPAATSGHADAQASLGWIYETGLGMPRDEATAAAWYARASASGHAVASHNLGILYAAGRGVPNDDTRALEYFYRAAAAGLADGYFSLGKMYQEGRGAPADKTAATECFRRAAQMGNPRAVRQLEFAAGHSIATTVGAVAV